MLEAAMDLHRAGVSLDFSAMTPSRHRLSLPAYAWEKTRWWNEASDARDGRLAPGGRGLFDVRMPTATPTWVVRLDSRHMAFPERSQGREPRHFSGGGVCRDGARSGCAVVRRAAICG
jgi:acyl transferase domain-containing protein